MRLEVGYINIKDVQFGSKTEVKGSVLYVDKQEMLDTIGGDPRLKSIDIDIAKPGEEVRITPVKDVIEPRVKVEGPGSIFSRVRQQGGHRGRREGPSAEGAAKRCDRR